MQAEVASGQSGCGRPGGQRCPEKLTQAFSGHIPIWPIAGEEGTDMYSTKRGNVIRSWGWPPCTGL